MSNQLDRIETLLTDLIGKIASVEADTTDIKNELSEFKHDTTREFKHEVTEADSAAVAN
ncbi:hypothetical protein [Cohnella silvisoli]|uniref:Uncharacterized protein n=1 Tax=Cohnella silvisoli TaxID=2873699 RepID=A0ABV1KTJ0_9BACL|nr:hypothetical protein [Cohnella silvisoli]MCD9022847.1 hypothetical protein [Cohnella silvisoli]